MVRLFIISIFFICSMAAKGQQIPSAIEKKLVDLPGTYIGKMPCADCSGIETTLTLQCDSLCRGGRYMRIDKYLNTKNGDQSNKIKGRWGLVDQNNLTEHSIVFIALYVEDTAKVGVYELKKDGNLLPVDKDMHKIEAKMDITLKKL